MVAVVVCRMYSLEITPDEIGIASAPRIKKEPEIGMDAFCWVCPRF